LSIEAVERILNELMQMAPQKSISAEAILQSVATVFDVRIADLKSDSRQKEIAFARQIAMYLAKEMLKDSLANIASSFGGKTHSTLLHAWKKIATLSEQEEALRRKLQMVRRHLEQM
jgi:chromosomal replication initiator protein